MWKDKINLLFSPDCSGNPFFAFEKKIATESRMGLETKI